MSRIQMQGSPGGSQPQVADLSASAKAVGAMSNGAGAANIGPGVIRGPLQVAFTRAGRDVRAQVGGFIVVAMALIALLSPTIAPYDPIKQNIDSRFAPPSAAHLFGTDNLGRDVFSRTLAGARVSLTVSLISVFVGIGVGVPLGLFAGYLGGWADSVIMRAIDFLLAFPGILLAIVIAGTLGPGLTNAMIAVGFLMVPTFARVIRGSTLSLKQSDFVMAARALGASPASIMLRHILPNVASPIIVLASLAVGAAILSTAGLSFVGLGALPPTPEWGAMMGSGRVYLRTEWWISTFPGLAITLLVIGVNLLGDALRDALDPRLSSISPT